MLIYDNAFPSNYDEIKTWYPVWYRGVFEMDALWKVWGGQLDSVQAGIIRAVDNNFLDFMDGRALSKLESFLGIPSDSNRTLDERRNVIRAFIIGSGKIGRPEIIAMLSQFTDGEIDVSFNAGLITVSVTRDMGDNFRLSDAYLVLGHRIPAHLGLLLDENTTPILLQNQNRFVFVNLKMGGGVNNRVIGVDGRMLDGSFNFDGSINFDSQRKYWNFGLSSVKYGAVFENHGEQGVDFYFDGRYNFDGSRNFGGGKYRIFGGLSGTLTIDNRWHFDGSQTFNGARNFDSKIETVEL